MKYMKYMNCNPPIFFPSPHRKKEKDEGIRFHVLHVHHVRVHLPLVLSVLLLETCGYKLSGLSIARAQGTTSTVSNAPSPHPFPFAQRTATPPAATMQERDRDPHAADPTPTPMPRCTRCAPCAPCTCSPGAHASALKSRTQNVDHHMQHGVTRNDTSRRTLYRHTPHAAVRANDERKKLNPGGEDFWKKSTSRRPGPGRSHSKALQRAQGPERALSEGKSLVARTSA